MAETNPSDPMLSVLLVDMPKEATDHFLARGFKVHSGSLGHPYTVRKADEYAPVLWEPTLPDGWGENDVVIVDLVRRTPLPDGLGTKVTSDGESDWWAKRSKGVIDPRPRTALTMQEQCDRIYRHGGAFIVFVDAEIPQVFWRARINQYSQLKLEQEITAHPWSFLSLLHHHLDIAVADGREISLEDGFDPLASLFGEHISEARYTCTARFTYGPMRDESAEFLVNKFGDSVGLMTKWRDSEGVIILLPQVRDKSGLAQRVLLELVPVLAPNLFPDAATSVWLRQDPYEHSSVLRIETEIREKQAALEREVSTLGATVAQIRAERQFLHDLITESGDALRSAVHEAFEYMGCPSVIDMDTHPDDESDTLAEDLRIDDSSPLIVVEVKGILGLPKDEDALAVAKYLAPAMKRLDRTDVTGLTVINHERARPPHERAGEPFRDLVVAAAESQDVALATAWDLFLLCRGVEQHSWEWSQIRPIFERAGRIRVLPTHYAPLATVVHVWPEAEVVGLQLEGSDLRCGDRIAWQAPWGFIEVAVSTMQVNDVPVQVAQAGDGVGVRMVGWTAPDIGAPIYRVSAQRTCSKDADSV